MSSSRGEYWRQAHGRVQGPAAAGPRRRRLHAWPAWSTARTRARPATPTASSPRRWPTSGSLGLLVALALLAAWLAAAGRTLGVRLRSGRIGPDWTAERIALTGLALTAVAYGIQSAIDWTWFIPGPTVAALAAAGFVAGRGPLAPGRRGRAAAAPPRPRRRDPLRLVAGGRRGGHRRCCAPGPCGSPSAASRPPTRPSRWPSEGARRPRWRRPTGRGRSTPTRPTRCTPAPPRWPRAGRSWRPTACSSRPWPSTRATPTPGCGWPSSSWTTWACPARAPVAQAAATVDPASTRVRARSRPPRPSWPASSRSWPPRSSCCRPSSRASRAAQP